MSDPRIEDDVANGLVVMFIVPLGLTVGLLIVSSFSSVGDWIRALLT